MLTSKRPDGLIKNRDSLLGECRGNGQTTPKMPIPTLNRLRTHRGIDNGRSQMVLVCALNRAIPRQTYLNAYLNTG